MARKRISFKHSDVARPPEGTPWIWLTRDLLSSPAWRAQSINCRRFVEFLLLEHMAHAGHENGNLVATYAQLEAFGIGRRLIGAAIEEAERLKLVEVRRGLTRAHAKTNPTRFRLTFLPTRTRDDKGTEYWIAASNEWRDYRPEPPNAPEPPIDSLVHEGEPNKCTKVNQSSAPSCTKAPNEWRISAVSADPALVHEGEPLYISRAPTASAVQTSLVPNAQHAGGGEIGSRAFADSTNPNSAAGSLSDEALRAALKSRAASERGFLTKAAGAVGISRQTLSNYVHGRYSINAGAAAKLRAMVLQ